MEDFEVTTADMLEIVAGGGNGAEYVNIVGLIDQAAKELREKDFEIERLRDALRAIATISDCHENARQIARAALGEEK